MFGLVLDAIGHDFDNEAHDKALEALLISGDGCGGAAAATRVGGVELGLDGGEQPSTGAPGAAAGGNDVAEQVHVAGMFGRADFSIEFGVVAAGVFDVFLVDAEMARGGSDGAAHLDHDAEAVTFLLVEDGGPAAFAALSGRLKGFERGLGGCGFGFHGGLFC